MAQKVLALTVDGQLTYCVASPENRGKGRCNHVEHQNEGQSIQDFMSHIESRMKVETPNDETLTILEQLDPTLLDSRSTTKRLGLRTDLDKTIDWNAQQEFIDEVVSKYANVEDPDWSQVVKNIGVDGIFEIGSKGDERYRGAKLIGVTEEMKYDYLGNDKHIVAKYEFEGREYEMSWGDIPAVNADGTIEIQGTKWRVLPIMEQHKAGLHAMGYASNVVQKDGHLAFSLRYDSKFINENGEEDWMVKSYGQEIPLSYARDYIFGKNDGEKLNNGPKYGLKNIDEAFFQRFPEFEKDISSIADLDKEEPNDLEWRRAIRYEDIVEDLMRKQARRIGVTFRNNLAKQEAAKAKGMSQEEADEKFPLFYQERLTENIKKDLAGRSNVQFADNLNAFAALSQAQKVSLAGKGSWNKDKVPRDLRLPHLSHQGLVDSMDVSSGHNVGLTLTLSGGYIGKDRLIHRKTPEQMKEAASLKDFVPFRLNNNTDRGSLSVAHLKQSLPIVGGEDPKIDTPAWNMMKGAKLGTNLRVAYVPNIGVYEDAIVISESTARKMATVKEREVYIDGGGTATDYHVGQKLRRGDKVGGNPIKVDSYVKAITENGVVIETPLPMTVGDKISGFAGNKGTVSKIIPDDEMPKMVNPEGLPEPAQIILSPMGVGGRRNIGQVLEANQNFDGKPNVESKRTVLLPDGHKIQATGGVAYFHRLNHIAQESISSYLNDRGSDGEVKGSRLGVQESILLSQNEDRLKVLDFLHNQEQSEVHSKLNSLFKSVGVSVKGDGLNLD